MDFKFFAFQRYHSKAMYQYTAQIKIVVY